MLPLVCGQQHRPDCNLSLEANLVSARIQSITTKEAHILEDVLLGLGQTWQYHMIETDLVIRAIRQYETICRWVSLSSRLDRAAKHAFQGDHSGRLTVH